MLKELLQSELQKTTEVIVRAESKHGESIKNNADYKNLVKYKKELESALTKKATKALVVCPHCHKSINEK